MSDKPRIGVLVSGRGTNLQAILDAIAAGTLAAEVALVISNRRGVEALPRAANAGVPFRVIVREDYPSRDAQHRAVLGALQEARVDLVVLAGYDRIVPKELVQAFPQRMINIHPSLLPAFAGSLRAQADALAHGVKLTGCTVHFVSEAVDAGPIIAQAAVPVLDDDTVESLSARILAEEHQLLPQAIGWLLAGRVQVDGRRVRIKP